MHIKVHVTPANDLVYHPTIGNTHHNAPTSEVGSFILVMQAEARKVTNCMVQSPSCEPNSHLASEKFKESDWAH
jgi:hypothetical protein